MAGALLVMLLLSIMGGSVLATAAMSRKSSDQENGITRARAAADSILLSLSNEMEKAFADGDVPFQLASDGLGVLGTVQDGLLSADVAIRRESDTSYRLVCRARFGRWLSGERKLTVLRNGDEVELQWDYE